LAAKEIKPILPFLRKRIAPRAGGIASIEQFSGHLSKSLGFEHSHLKLVPRPKLLFGEVLVQRTEGRVVLAPVSVTT
jgi:hypothetical protein